MLELPFFGSCKSELEVQQAVPDEAEELLTSLTADADEFRNRIRQPEAYIVSCGLPFSPDQPSTGCSAGGSFSL